MWQSDNLLSYQVLWDGGGRIEEEEEWEEMEVKENFVVTNFNYGQFLAAVYERRPYSAEVMFMTRNRHSRGDVYDRKLPQQR